MIEPNHFAIPPWRAGPDWSQAVHSLKHLSAGNWAKLMQARKLADRIEKKLYSIDDGLATLCNATCSTCIDICCEKATVWYDFKDLLYLCLRFNRLPASQIYKKTDLTCRHLGSTGCNLPRPLRPFICTWYLCPNQAALCSGQGPEGWHRLQGAIQEIQGLRRQLESEFIQAVR